MDAELDIMDAGDAVRSGTSVISLIKLEGVGDAIVGEAERAGALLRRVSKVVFRRRGGLPFLGVRKSNCCSEEVDLVAFSARRTWAGFLLVAGLEVNIAMILPLSSFQ
jgi:hypothetical protein